MPLTPKDLPVEFAQSISIILNRTQETSQLLNENIKLCRHDPLNHVILRALDNVLDNQVSLAAMLVGLVEAIKEE